MLDAAEHRDGGADHQHVPARVRGVHRVLHRLGHTAVGAYLFLGLHGYNALVPWIWTAIGLNTFALLILYLPITRSVRASA